MLPNDCHFNPIYYTNGDIQTSTEVFVLLFERRSSRMYLMIGELVMGRTIITWLLICGLGLIALGFAMSLPMQSVRAQDDSTDAAPAQDDSATAPAQQDAAVSAEQAEYIGLNDCEDCHRNLARDHVKTPHALALQDVEKSKKAILGDFEQGADVRMVQFPGEDAPRPFTADDIVFAIGSGRYAQRYVYEVEKRVYAVFPAEWDTVNQVWQPYTRAESWPAPEYDFTNNCAGCHTTGLEVAKSKWEDEGVQCEACHGPGSIHKDLAWSRLAGLDSKARCSCMLIQTTPSWLVHRFDSSAFKAMAILRFACTTMPMTMVSPMPLAPVSAVSRTVRVILVLESRSKLFSTVLELEPVEDRPIPLAISAAVVVMATSGKYWPEPASCMSFATVRLSLCAVGLFWALTASQSFMSTMVCRFLMAPNWHR
jgi:hypothetical protein